MLTYYHGTTKSAADCILKNGIDISRGGGELGQGFYIGSSLWRAYSWAWSKAQAEEYRVIEFMIDENTLNNLNLECRNRRSTKLLFTRLQKTHCDKTWISDCDAIWAPIVGKDIQNVYQIKIESQRGLEMLQQKKILESPQIEISTFMGSSTSNIGNSSKECVRLLFPSFEENLYSKYDDRSKIYSGTAILAIEYLQNPPSVLSIRAIKSGTLISVDLIYMPKHFYRAQVEGVGTFYFLIEKPIHLYTMIGYSKVPLSVLTPVNEYEFSRACKEHHFFFVGE